MLKTGFNGLFELKFSIYREEKIEFYLQSMYFLQQIIYFLQQSI